MSVAESVNRQGLKGNLVMIEHEKKRIAFGLFVPITLTLASFFQFRQRRVL
jgi:hypothetical protein